MGMGQQLMRIASMLQQEKNFSISKVQQSMRITLMLQQERTFKIGLAQQSMRDNFTVTCG